MRKLLAAGAGICVACVLLAVPAIAQTPSPAEPLTTLDVDAKVVPNRAGTPKKPQGIRIEVRARLATTEGFEKPIVQKVVSLFPRYGNYNGGKYAKCTLRKLEQDTGPKGCPRKSIMGGGYAIAYADTVLTKATIVVVNGGAKVSYGYVTLYNPALVQKPVPAKIEQLKGKWKYRVTVKIPEVLQVVAGIPIAAKDLLLKFGGKPYARNWIETTGCPKSRRWPYHTDVYLSTGQMIKYDNSVACKPAKR